MALHDRLPLPSSGTLGMHAQAESTLTRSWNRLPSLCACAHPAQNPFGFNGRIRFASRQQSFNGHYGFHVCSCFGNLLGSNCLHSNLQLFHPTQGNRIQSGSRTEIHVTLNSIKKFNLNMGIEAWTNAPWIEFESIDRCLEHESSPISHTQAVHVQFFPNLLFRFKSLLIIP